MGLPHQSKEKGVHGKVVEDGREWASLLESVFHRDRDVVRSEEERFGNDVAEKGAEGVGGLGRETDQAEEGEEVVWRCCRMHARSHGGGDDMARWPLAESRKRDSPQYFARCFGRGQKRVASSQAAEPDRA